MTTINRITPRKSKCHNAFSQIKGVKFGLGDGTLCGFLRTQSQSVAPVFWWSEDGGVTILQNELDVGWGVGSPIPVVERHGWLVAVASDRFVTQSTPHDVDLFLLAARSTEAFTIGPSAWKRYRVGSLFFANKQLTDTSNAVGVPSICADNGKVIVSYVNENYGHVVTSSGSFRPAPNIYVTHFPLDVDGLFGAQAVSLIDRRGYAPVIPDARQEGVIQGFGAPSIAAQPGTMYIRLDATDASNVFYIKSYGYGVSGWVDRNTFMSSAFRTFIVERTTAGSANMIVKGTHNELLLENNAGNFARLLMGNSELARFTPDHMGLGSAQEGKIFWGQGSPEGVISAARGALFLRTDGGAGSTLWVKESGTGNSGWSAK